MKNAAMELQMWVSSGNSLLARARALLATAPHEKMREIANKIPQAIMDEDHPPVLVFAGQYSSGKSTIMKVLTGKDDIAVGADITTQTAQTYDWEGIKVVDTPGVHTELRPDHDEITYRAIAEADLLVFVVTNELFDSQLAQHFRKLAVERDKGHEMILVVNKMQRCAQGNTEEVRHVIREDLRKVLTPFTPEDLRLSFIDAETALASKEETDPELAAALWRKSGFDDFIGALNDFVRTKGVMGRYTTALYRLEQALQEALAAESTGDKDSDAMIELLLQRRRTLMETHERIRRTVAYEIQRICAQIREEGRNVADMLSASADPNSINRRIQASQARVELLAQQLAEKIQEIIVKQIEECDTHITTISQGELAKELQARLKHTSKDTDLSADSIAKIKYFAEISRKLGDFLVINSVNPIDGGYSHTNTHELVKEIGHLLGKVFKPWEAVRWTRIIANTGKVLQVVETTINVFIDIIAMAEESEQERMLQESRSALRQQFNDVAHAIEMRYDEKIGAFVATTVSKEIEITDKNIEELQNRQKARSELRKKLSALLAETREMINRFHALGDTACQAKGGNA